MKTQLDLYRSAMAAAEKAMPLEKRYEIDRLALDSFNKANHAPEDWTLWREMFDEASHRFSILSKMKLPSEVNSPTVQSSESTTTNPTARTE